MPSNLLILMADQLTARRPERVRRTVPGRRTLTPWRSAGLSSIPSMQQSPVRAVALSFLAGQLPSRIGAYDNAAEFPRRRPPSPTTCAAPAIKPRWRQDALCGPDQLHGFEERLTTDIYPADFGWTPDWTRFDERPAWYHTMDSVTQAGPCVRTNQIDFDDEVVYAARQKLFDIARGRDPRPFCLVVSMTHPHDPYAIPQPYWDRYRDSDIEMPQVGASSVADDPHSQPAAARHWARAANAQ